MNPVTVVLVLLLGVLFFGKDLPEIAKKVGLSLMEFRKGLSEVNESARGMTLDHTLQSEIAVDEPEKLEKFESFGTKFEPPANI